jgi:hypothetical protein
MKNLHVLPTDKPSRLFLNKNNNQLFLNEQFDESSPKIIAQHIHITSNKEIKEGIDQWYLDKVLNEPYNSGGAQYSSKQDVIILTTDQDLIADGVQSIDDDFLEWFVKNPSCESISVEKLVFRDSRVGVGYKIIIPKEEPKQETLEEAAKRLCPNSSWRLGFINGAKWQQERSYSEEEVENIITKLMHEVHTGDVCYGNDVIDFKISPRKWFEQFKKK